MTTTVTDPGVLAAVRRLAHIDPRTPGLHRAPGAAPAPVQHAGDRCMFSATISSERPSERVLLTCDRRPGHPGPHWDETDNIAWKYGCPPSEQEARNV